MPLLDLREVSVRYGDGPAVFEGVSLALERGERVGIAGESGCGKTTLLKAVLGLLPAGSAVGGVCLLEGRAGYIPQRGLASLSPFLTAGEQIGELTGSARRTAEWLALAGMGNARFAQAYPHQLSGGERQRVLALQALALCPDVILSDEPTANLDPEREEALLALLDEATRASGAALLIASHRESVFQRLGCRVWRMTPEPAPGAPPDREPDQGVRRGRGRPPHTDFCSELGRQDTSSTGATLVEVRGLGKTFRRRDGLLRSHAVVRALDGVSMRIAVGECVALRGPSGAGKSTLARCLAGREMWDEGSIDWPGGRRVQLVQQEASESLNARVTIGEALREACGEADSEWLPKVRLPREWVERKAGALSEGQRARVAIARAVAALREGLLILDESLSGLDSGTRGEIVGFLNGMRRERQLSLLVVTHDSEVCAQLGARVVAL